MHYYHKLRLSLLAGLFLAALMPHAAWCASDNGACLACHPAPGFKERLASGAKTSLPEEVQHFLGSAHAGMSCVDCHPGTTLGPHAVKPTVRECAACHRPEGEVPGYKSAPLVAQLHPMKSSYSPVCQTCHGHHGIGRPDDPTSTVYWNNVPRLCASCHVKASLSQLVPQVAGYFESIHGRLAAQPGKQRPAVCTDCHMLHKVSNHAPTVPGQTTLIPAREIRSQVCGTCHKTESKEYDAGVHGQAVARGVTDAPVCTDCHGEHKVQPVGSETSAVNPKHIVETCAGCHGNQRYVKLHRLPTTKVSSYMESYHGQANEYGDVKVATCVSCHGKHEILPARSPLSSVNGANLAQTCGKCHPGAGTTFPISRVHVAPHWSEANLLLLLQGLYLLIILGSGAGFVAYIGLDLFAHWRLKQAGVTERLEHRLRHLPVAPPSALVRMLPVERVQHVLLLVSFFVLAFTGLALVFPGTLFGKIIVMLCGGPAGRAIVHRVAAAVMVVNFVVQGIWMGTTKHGRETVRALFPAPSDLWDLWQSIVLYLGFSHYRPSFRRFGYPEKFEFWALVWGTFVMTVTGSLLMWVNWTLAHMPKLVLDLALIVHKWEAILAVEAILVWHLYHVIWKPDVYPGNASWITGKISFEELVMKHPLEYARAMGWLGKRDDTAEESVEGASEETVEGTPKEAATPPSDKEGETD